MKKLLGVLSLFLTVPNVYASDTIRFSAQMEDEALAEEAILLVHCLANRSGLPWEFTGETRGNHWLRLQEKNQVAHGTYKNAEKEEAFVLRSGEADTTCEQLEPSSPSPKLGSAEEVAPLPRLGGTESAESTMSAPNKKVWLWLGLGAAAITGFLIYKARQPQHRTIEMN